MSTHPNAMLLLELTPDDLSRKTYRAILADAGGKDEGDDSEGIKIGQHTYMHRVMEDDYYEDSQVAAKPGSIVLWDLVTYGYGERIGWRALEERKDDLDEWAARMCKKHHCSYAIFVSANYW